MNAFTRDSHFGVTSETQSNWVSLTETYWGYVIRSDSTWSTRAVLIERMAAVTGAVFLMVAAAHWMLPEVRTGVLDTAEGRLASSIALGISGMIFLWVSGRGLCHELQVDMTLRCLRKVVRNRNGRTRVEMMVSFDDIASAYVRRPEIAGASAALYVRSKAGKVMRVATGSAATMEVLNLRLTDDVRPQGVKVDGWQRVGYKLVPAKSAKAKTEAVAA